MKDPSGGLSEKSGEIEGLACLAEGIFAYLQELDDYRTLCRKHEGKVAVCEEESEIRVIRFFEHRNNVILQLESALRQLISVQDYRRFRRGWNGEEGEEQRNITRTSDPSPPLVRSCITWGCYQFLVQAEALETSALLQVTLHVLPSGRDLPELPLRLLAEAIRCHEFLIPDAVVSPLPTPPGKQLELLGLRQYLLRAIPPNRVASQCI